MGWWNVRFDPLSFVIGKHGDSGPVRDVVSYLMGRAVAAAGEIWQTITNVAVASFTAVSTTLRNLVIDVTPLQSGSGDPSPTNVRPINGWTGAQIVVSPTLDAQDGTTYIVSWQSEAGTVYGGILTDNGDGTWTLTVNKASAKIGDLTKYGSFVSGTNAVAQTYDLSVSATSVVSALRGAICSMAIEWNSDFGSNAAQKVDGGLPTGTYGFAISNGGSRVAVYSKTAMTSAEFDAAFADARVVYPIATQTYPLIADSVEALLGQNNIFADCGNINTITFRTN